MSTRIKVNAFFPFCRVKITDQRVNNQLDQVLIKIEPNQRYLPVCSNCQKKVRLIHSYTPTFNQVDSNAKLHSTDRSDSTKF